MSHKKFGPDRFSRFDVYWIQTDKPNLYIDIKKVCGFNNIFCAFSKFFKNHKLSTHKFLKFWASINLP